MGWVVCLALALLAPVYRAIIKRTRKSFTCLLEVQEARERSRSVVVALGRRILISFRFVLTADPFRITASDFLVKGRKRLCD